MFGVIFVREANFNSPSLPKTVFVRSKVGEGWLVHKRLDSFTVRQHI